MNAKADFGVAGLSGGRVDVALDDLIGVPDTERRVSLAEAAAHAATPFASIIPSPGTPPAAVNVTATTMIDGGTHTVAAGTQLRATGVTPIFAGPGYATLINKGVIWNEPAGAGAVTNGVGVDNQGTMVVRTQGTNAATAIASGSEGNVVNSGGLFALADQGRAVAITSDYRIKVTNSGVIAASSNGESVNAIYLVNGGSLVNHAGGKVLAEGMGAVGISIRGDQGPLDGVHVRNAGLIEAQSNDDEVGSVAIYFTGLSHQNYVVENSGTIRGDWAILSDSLSWATTAQRPTETVRNLAGGVIEGEISLDRGNDTLVNAGTIRGYVAMGEGADSVDNSAGLIDGIVDLGWGNDSFKGGSGFDKVGGDNGNDILTGNGGNDLLLGGGNDDVITGGAGNDGLFGEYGNDRIVTLEGDYASGGAGNDRIEAGDYKFALIDGGSGFDTLVLAAGRIFDLSAALAEEAIFDIEAIELGGSREIVIRAADIPAISEGKHQLRIGGVSSDKIDLVGSWTASGTTVIDGVTYRQFVSGAETVLVSGAAVVTVMTTAPAGAIGLDAFTGEGPPLPGEESGLDFTPLELYLSSYQLTEDVIVNPEELFWSDGYYVFQADNSDITLTNHGVIASYTDWDQAYGANTVYGRNLKLLVNTGTLTAIWDYDRGVGVGEREEFAGFTSGMARGNRIENSGLISAETFHGIAMGSTQAGHLINTGEISAYSEYGFATAVDEPGIFENRGDVIAEGGWSAIGVHMRYPNLTNEGSIIARTTLPGALESIGVQFSLGFPGAFTNDGVIVADIAFQLMGPPYSGYAPFALTNKGMMSGRVELGQSDDRVVNTGIIYGDIELDTGDDVFDGSAGRQDGTVDGGAGNDRLTGGVGNDRLFGGSGVDTLKGLDGNDVLVGGDGGPVDQSITLGANVTRNSKETAVAVSNFTLAPASGFTGVTPRASVNLTGTSAVDWLRITVEKAGQVTILADHLTFDPSMALIDEQGNSYHAGLGGGDSSLGTYSRTWNLEPGTYYLQFFEYRTGVTPANVDYRLHFFVPGQTVIPWTTTGSTLDGGVGDDVLTGGASDDTLIGGTGVDRMTGGAGNDSYDVDQQADLIFEDANGGVDKVTARAGFYLYANVENLTLAAGAGNIFGVGNELANTLLGNEGSNLLIAGAGDDVVRGGAGVDSLFGQDGADQLFGDAGVDYLVGGAGNDTLDGGADADALYGEDGDDTLIGGSGFVTDILVGGAGNDTLRGDSGQADYDLMDGGAGDDTYYVDTGDDLTFEAVNGGTDTVYANVAGANNGVYLYANVENLVLLGTTAFGVGNDLANRLTGSGSANWLLGGAGNDIINGKGGDDVLFGEGGADTFVFERGSGADVIGDFTVGTDKIDLSAFGFTTYQAVQAAMREVNGITAIDLAKGDMIVLHGVSNAALSGGDFILAPLASTGAPDLQARVAGDAEVVGRADLMRSELWTGGAARIAPVASAAVVPVIQDLALGGLLSGGPDPMVSAVDLVPAPTSTNPFIKALTGTYAYRAGYEIVYALQGNPGDAGLLGGALWAQQGAAAAFQGAAAAWMAVANIVMKPATAAYDGTGSRAGYSWVERLTALEDDVLGQHALPGPGNLFGEFNNTHEIFTAANNARGGYSFLTFLHEIGHGLGLMHPHDEGNSFPGVDGDDDTGDFGHNQSVYTVMSYNDDIADQNAPSYASGWAATPMAFDIAVIQAMYGANMTTATGDNVYLVPGIGGAGAYWSCIWDAGGIDTISAAAGSVSVVIDLRAATLLNAEGGGGYLTRGNNLAGGLTIANGVVIENATGGSGHDTIRGNDVANRLLGGAGDDTIHGFGGDDYIDGGTGKSMLYGGDGNDQIYAATLGSAPDSTLDGGSGDDWLTGGAGHDIFYGGAGTDQFWGGAGNDQYHVDSQTELVFEDANGGNDTVFSSASFYLYGNIETLILEGDASFGVGNALDNNIEARGGNSVLLIGLGGNDMLLAAAANDQLFGGEGNDWLRGGAGIDYLVGGIGDDRMDGGADADALYGEDGDDNLDAGTGFVTDILVGGAGNDILGGDSGLGDYDRMDGGAGDDTYFVDTGDDLTFEAVGGGIDTVHANVRGENNGVYLYANVENLVLVNETAFGVGNELANVMTGSNASNWLLGGAGNDTLNGKRGSDVLFGEAGADTFVFERGTGGDVIGDFVSGTDKIDLRAFGLTSLAQVQAGMVENGGTTAINLGNGDFIVINGVANATLKAGDFLLATATSADEPAVEDVVVMAMTAEAPWHDLPDVLIAARHLVQDGFDMPLM